MIRGVAALLVMTGHLRALFFKGKSSGEQGVLKNIFFFMTGFGHQAVIVFFVLSGFLISKNIYAASQKRTWSTGRYAIDRLVRLWIVLVPALLLTATIDHIGLKFFSNSMAYQGNIEYIAFFKVADNLRMSYFFGNLIFLQSIFVPMFGCNAPLWSLANEFWYYILFPVIYFIFLSKKNFQRAILVVSAIAIFYLIGRSISLYFIVWLMGFAAMFIKERYKFPDSKIVNWLLLVTSILLGIVLCSIRLNIYPVAFNDFSLAAVISSFIFCLTYKNLKNQYLSPIFSFFSEISYSLYAIHMPLCFFITSWIIYDPVDWSIKYFLIYILVALCIIVIAFIFWFLFESRYKQVQNFVKAKLLFYKPELQKQ